MFSIRMNRGRENSLAQGERPEGASFCSAQCLESLRGSVFQGKEVDLGAGVLDRKRAAEMFLPYPIELSECGVVRGVRCAAEFWVWRPQPHGILARNRLDLNPSKVPCFPTFAVLHHHLLLHVPSVSGECHSERSVTGIGDSAGAGCGVFVSENDLAAAVGRGFAPQL